MPDGGFERKMNVWKIDTSKDMLEENPSEEAATVVAGNDEKTDPELLAQFAKADLELSNKDADGVFFAKQPEELGTELAKPKEFVIPMESVSDEALTEVTGSTEPVTIDASDMVELASEGSEEAVVVEDSTEPKAATVAMTSTTEQAELGTNNISALSEVKKVMRSPQEFTSGHKEFNDEAWFNAAPAVQAIEAFQKGLEEIAEAAKPESKLAQSASKAWDIVSKRLVDLITPVVVEATEDAPAVRSETRLQVGKWGMAIFAALALSAGTAALTKDFGKNVVKHAEAVGTMQMAEK